MSDLRGVNKRITLNRDANIAIVSALLVLAAACAFGFGIYSSMPAPAPKQIVADSSLP